MEFSCKSVRSVCVTNAWQRKKFSKQPFKFQNTFANSMFYFCLCDKIPVLKTAFLKCNLYNSIYTADYGIENVLQIYRLYQNLKTKIPSKNTQWLSDVIIDIMISLSCFIVHSALTQWKYNTYLWKCFNFIIGGISLVRCGHRTGLVPKNQSS